MLSQQLDIWWVADFSSNPEKRSKWYDIYYATPTKHIHY